MDRLRVELGLERPDDFYDMLMRSFDGLCREKGELLMASLVLVLANQIGDQRLLSEALVIAREEIGEGTCEQCGSQAAKKGVS